MPLSSALQVTGFRIQLNQTTYRSLWGSLATGSLSFVTYLINHRSGDLRGEGFSRDVLHLRGITHFCRPHTAQPGPVPAWTLGTWLTERDTMSREVVRINPFMGSWTYACHCLPRACPPASEFKLQKMIL